MKIDIQEIVNAKIKEMEANQTVEKAVQETLETSIIKAVTDALGGYKIRRQIEEKVSKEVSRVVEGIGFTAYNGFIAEKVKQITEGICRQDIAEKIQKTFDEMLVVKHDNIKLSEICEAYRKWICDDVDECEKYSLERFWVSVNQSKYGWLEFKFGKEAPERHSCRSDYNSVEFIVHRNLEDNKIGCISNVYIDGHGIDKEIDFGHMSGVQLLLINLAYNKTPIIIDVEHEDDINSHFDVDI